MKRALPYYPIRLLILALVFTGFGESLRGQDIHFSQFFETPLLRNPALAGIFTGDYRIQMVYRDQWRSVTNAYTTGSLNGEYKLPIGKADDFVTVGGQLLYDRAGTTALTQVSALPAVNYHKSLSAERNRYLSVGFMGGVVNRHFDRSKITTDNTYNTGQDGESVVVPSYTYMDGSVGMSFNSNLSDKADDNFYLGLAYHHFTHPANTFFRDPTVQLQPKWVASAGFRFGVTDVAYLTLLGDYSQQASYREFCLGTMVGMKIGSDMEKPDYVLHGGLFVRWEDALIPVIKLDHSGFSFAFSYDVNTSKLRPASLGQGGFELSVAYTGLLNRASRSTLNSTLCPRF